jgi:hypothetical protein
MKPPGKRSTVQGSGKRRPVIAQVYNRKGTEADAYEHLSNCPLGRIVCIVEQKGASRSLRSEPLVVGQQFKVPKNSEQRTSELSLIVVTDVVAPHWLSSPIRS